MLELFVAFLGELARALTEVVVATLAPPATAASQSEPSGAIAEQPTIATSRARNANALPASDALRAIFANDRQAPADWLARVRDASGPLLTGGLSPMREAPQMPAQQAVSSANASTSDPGSPTSRASANAPRTATTSPQSPTTSPPPIAPSSANDPTSAASPTAESVPDFVREERALNPNFGGEPAAPHPVAHTWDALPVSPGRPDLAPNPLPSADSRSAATTSVTAPPAVTNALAPSLGAVTEPTFVAQERALNPNFGIVPGAPHPVARAWDSLPLSPARTGTVEAHEPALANLGATAHQPSGPHAWDSLPLSPMRAGDPGAHGTPGNPPAAAQPESPGSAPHATTSEETSAWPTLPQWPPQRADDPVTRRKLRDSAETSWYV